MVAIENAFEAARARELSSLSMHICICPLQQRTVSESSHKTVMPHGQLKGKQAQRHRSASNLRILLYSLIVMLLTCKAMIGLGNEAIGCNDNWHLAANNANAGCTFCCCQIC